MRAAFYDHQGAARDVLQVGELPDPMPGAGEVRVRVQASGLNPSDRAAATAGRRRPPTWAGAGSRHDQRSRPVQVKRCLHDNRRYASRKLPAAVAAQAIEAQPSFG